jgi:hypothetical protein
LELHRKLGKFHELALTFTMIAGLLNILVILDVLEGPAYGYGDEESTSRSDSAVPPQEPAAGSGNKRGSDSTPSTGPPPS